MSGSVVSESYCNNNVAGPATAFAAGAGADSSSTAAANKAVAVPSSLEERIQADLDDANVLVHSVSIASHEVTLYILEDDDDSTSEGQQQQQQEHLYVLSRRQSPNEENDHDDENNNGNHDRGEADFNSPTRSPSQQTSSRTPLHESSTPPVSNRRIAKTSNSSHRHRSSSPMPPTSCSDASTRRRSNSESHSGKSPDEPYRSNNNKLRSRSLSSSSSSPSRPPKTSSYSSSGRSPSPSTRPHQRSGDSSSRERHRKRSPDSPPPHNKRVSTTRERSSSSSSRTKNRGATCTTSATSRDREDRDRHHYRQRDRDRDRSRSENRESTKTSVVDDDSHRQRSRSTSIHMERGRREDDDDHGGGGGAGDMDASMRRSTRRTRSRTPRTATSGESPSAQAIANSSSMWSSRHHPQDQISSNNKVSRSSSPSHSSSRPPSHHHSSQKDRPNRSRSASCHRPYDEHDKNNQERRSRSTSRPTRLPQYSNQQKQRKLSSSASGSDGTSRSGGPSSSLSSPAPRGSDPLAFVLTSRSPMSSPKVAVPDLVSATALRDAILERTQLMALREAAVAAEGGIRPFALSAKATTTPSTPLRKEPRSASATLGGCAATATTAASVRGSDPPGHYLGSLNTSIRGSLQQAILGVKGNPNHRATTTTTMNSLQSPTAAAAAAAARPLPSASLSPPYSLSPSSLLQDHDNSTSTSASLQLDLVDPAQVNTLVSPRTVMTLETKDSLANATTARRYGIGGGRRTGNDNEEDDDDNDDDTSQGDSDDGANHGDDMSIFSELWGSSTKVAVKVEEDRTVEVASNPNLDCEMNSPDKKKRSIENGSPNEKTTGKKVPKRTVSEGSSKGMMKSLSDLLEANMGGLLESPDRAKRRASRRAGNSPESDNNNAKSLFNNMDDDDDDTCSLLLDDENAKKARNGLNAVKSKADDEDDATSVMTPFMVPEIIGFGQLGKIKDAGRSLFKSPSQWRCKPPSATQRRTSKPPPPPPPPKAQPEQAPYPTRPAVDSSIPRGESPETSETMATSFGSSLSERTNNAASLKPGVSARKKDPDTRKKATVKSSMSDDVIDENLAAFSSILDANSELTKAETPGFTKFVDSTSRAKSTQAENNKERSGPRFPKVSTGGFGRPSLGSISNPLSGVVTSAKRVFRPRRGLSAAAETSSSFRASHKPERRSVVGNCYDMRGFNDE